MVVMESVGLSVARTWSLCVGVILILPLVSTDALAEVRAPQHADGPLPPTGVNVNAAPATRIKQFEAYLEGLPYQPGDRVAKAIVTRALDEGTLSPVLGMGITFTTCNDFINLLPSWSEPLKVALEPTFAPCYEKPNSPVVYDDAELRAYLDKVNAEFPSGSGRGSAIPFYSFYDNFYQLVRNKKNFYLQISAPYAQAYNTQQARRTAEKKQATELAAKAERAARMANADILGIGLDTSREAFAAISAKGRNVWSCVQDAKLRSEICTGKVLNEDCTTASNGLVAITECRVYPDPMGAASPALTRVSTIVGRPVSKIVVSYFNGKIERIRFTMVNPNGYGPDRTDYYSALRQKFGEPEKGGYWEGEDSRLTTASVGITDGTPVSFVLERPSVVAAKMNLAQSLKVNAQQAEQRRQQELNKNL